MSENVLELRNITKSFDGVEVLHTVSFIKFRKTTGQIFSVDGGLSEAFLR